MIIGNVTLHNVDKEFKHLYTDDNNEVTSFRINKITAEKQAKKTTSLVLSLKNDDLLICTTLQNNETPKTEKSVGK